LKVHGTAKDFLSPRIFPGKADPAALHPVFYALRFLCFGKEGRLRGREFSDQLHTFSCLSVLHNAVVAWNMVHLEPVIEQLRAEGQHCDDELLSLTTPLLRRHINPFGRYHFDLARMRQDGG
jgi:hypothetical protein